jgi:uncharacterized delta-60 repeat protein
MAGQEDATQVSWGSEVLLTGPPEAAGIKKEDKMKGQYRALGAFLLLALAFPATLMAQLDQLWVADYDGPDTLSQEGAEALAVDAYGNVYVTGHRDGGVRSGSEDYFTIKYDPSTGETLWTNSYNGPADSADAPSAIALDLSGDYVYVTGRSAAGTDISKAVDWDYATVKYNASDGGQCWVARYAGPNNRSDIANALAVDNAGGVYVTGYSSNGIANSYDYVTVKYNASDGSQRWVARYDYALDGYDCAHDITVDPSGDYVYVTGSSEGKGSGHDDDYATVKYNASDGSQIWVARYNGPGGGDPTDVATAIAVDPSGSYLLVTGYSNGATSGYNYDYTTLKYGADGSLLWEKRYNGLGDGSDYAYAIAVDASGNVCVTGQSSGSGTGYDYATIRYDANGNELWVARYNGPGNGYDIATAIALDALDNVYVTGSSAGSGTGYDYATVKYDASGNVVWTQHAGGAARYNGPASGWDESRSIAVDHNGGVYVTGQSLGAVHDYDFATVKYDASGTEQWRARYGVPLMSRELGRRVVTDASGNVYVTGYSANSEADADKDYVTIKYNSSGVRQWAALYDGPAHGHDEANAIAVDASGNVYVTGFCQFSAGDYNIATVKYNSYGVRQWCVWAGWPASSDGATAIALDAAGNIYVTGYSAGSGTARDYFTLMYNSNGQPQWSALYDGPASGDDEACAIALGIVRGNVYVYVTGSSAGSGTYDDYATVKYDAAGKQQWVARYEGLAYDWAKDIAVDASGNAYVTGRSQTVTGDDYVTVKYNSRGIQQWVASYDGGSRGQAAAIAVDASGNSYVTGSCFTSAGAAFPDYGTVKYNSSGVEQWARLYDGPVGSVDYAYDIALDGSGNAYVTGTSRGSIMDDYATVGYDAAGNPLGTARYGGSWNDQAYAIAVDDLGDVCVTGRSWVDNQDYNITTIKYHVAPPPGWSARASLPTAPSGAFEDAGGWLAYDVSRELVYAAKGNNTGDFYSYNPVTNGWTTLTSIPAYQPGGSRKKYLPGAGCRGVSDGNSTIYMTVGNNTPGFYRYSAGAWTPLADLLASAGAGTDAVFAEGQVYLLNGPSSKLYRYNPTLGTWADLGPLPGTGAWGDGSWLVFDGVQTLYAHRKVNRKAPYNEIWTYDLAAETWSAAPQAGMPGAAALSGSAGAWFDDAVYALTGNSTREFWKLVPGSGWTTLENVPAPVSTGGDICANGSKLFAFSGGLTNQFWRYVRPPEGASGDGAGAKTTTLPTKFALSVAPNPMRLGTAVHYSVPAATNVSLKLYDITGALARTVSSGPAKPGRYTANLSAKGLARGVYVLKLQSDACSLTRKVVIQ